MDLLIKILKVLVNKLGEKRAFNIFLSVTNSQIKKSNLASLEKTLSFLRTIVEKLFPQRKIEFTAKFSKELEKRYKPLSKSTFAAKSKKEPGFEIEVEKNKKQPDFDIELIKEFKKMKVSKEILKQIIAEEIQEILNEQTPPGAMVGVSDFKRRLNQFAASLNSINNLKSLRVYYKDRWPEDKKMFGRFERQAYSLLVKRFKQLKIGKASFKAAPKKKSRWKVCKSLPVGKYCMDPDRKKPGLIKTIQTLLNKKGMNAGKVDGYFGGKTEKAVRQFKYQNASNAAVADQGWENPDGKVDEITFKFLKGEMKTRKASPPEKGMMPTAADKRMRKQAQGMLKKKQASPEEKYMDDL